MGNKSAEKMEQEERAILREIMRRKDEEIAERKTTGVCASCPATATLEKFYTLFLSELRQENSESKTDFNHYYYQSPLKVSKLKVVSEMVLPQHLLDLTDAEAFKGWIMNGCKDVLTKLDLELDESGLLADLPTQLLESLQRSLRIGNALDVHLTMVWHSVLDISPYFRYLLERALHGYIAWLKTNNP